MKKITASFRMRFFIMVLIPLSSCIHRKQIEKQKLFIETENKTSKNIAPLIENPPITIWVHGTLILRKPPYHLIFDDKTCLVAVLSLPEDHHFRLLASAMAEQDSTLFPSQEFYIFSWSGKLQEKERKEAAYKLYNEIISLQTLYMQQYGTKPLIRIISRSHGGNVVLNMAKIKSNQIPFNIESVMLACPVQEKTKHLICSPLFKRVYSLYSSFDIIQIIAPQFKRTYPPKRGKIKHTHRYHIPPFSSRIFPIYSHLTQAKIKINDLPISHTRFSTREFASMLPIILKKLNIWHSESIHNNTICKYKLLSVYRSKNC